MNAAVFIALTALALVAAAAIAWAWSERRRAAAAEGHAWEMKARALDAEARLKALESQAAQQAEVLKAQAAQSASAVAEALVKQTEETFRNREQLAQARLEAQLKPVAETLAKFQEQVALVEQKRAEETGGLKAQIAQLLAASTATQEEARKLSAALRRGAGVQGRWGEQALRNVLEAAGLNHHFDFHEQTSTDTEEGRRRPDVTVRLPGGAVFVIDAKVSCNAYLESLEAADEAAREACLARHVQSVRAHIQGLSAKAYWNQFDASPDFVAMFVPSDAILAAALDKNPELLTEAMDRRVLVVTPTTLFALCKAVVYGWRVEEQAANAQEIAKLGQDLYSRISVMAGHVDDLGTALGRAVGKYNAFVGSLKDRVLPQARKFEQLAADHQAKKIPDPVELEVAPRELEARGKSLLSKVIGTDPEPSAALTEKSR
ncbi:MAG: DNA recombination protein RmuC [Phenylobacterium sp.]|uniref:DNA recombination protein RmuC n=1 Tax=Phenylobacterium sp. TaxID=1871053 RepID=UPI002A26E73E|nr:DNA recombination protein RmuC [Phenylobacterium sp.]MDD3838284.1 DNA recombination protein RmuC [Phenylobacterium sp.]MDX9999186.1 DNA recombination protein RmuC [Phenylobacterium sp.]